MYIVSVTVTEAVVLCSLQEVEDRGSITESPYLGARRQNET